MNQYNDENMLEKAIREGNPKLLIQGIAEEEVWTDLTGINSLDRKCFSDEMILSLLTLSTPKESLEQIVSDHRIGTRIRKLAETVLAPLPHDPSPEEKALIKAIVYSKNEEIIRLICEDRMAFRGFTPDLLRLLPMLSQSAVLAFLRDGLSLKLKAIVLGILLKEVGTPSLLQDFSYKDRTRYANLMLHIVAGENIRDDLPWFPDCSEYPFFYYFDPKHQFDPAR